jgi:glycolate oxidase FAD binding subunit
LNAAASNTDCAAYAIDARTPQRLEHPGTVDELVAVLRSSEARSEAVVLFGGGTLQTLGFAPERFDVAIDLRQLERIAAYEPRDLTIGIEAGATVEKLSAALAQNGQFLPIDVPQPARATIGGTFAAGWLGPRRGTYGRPRDSVIGSIAVLADGTIAHAGGMVVKNVTGYDMSRLYIGSFGTLVALAQLNLRTLPRAPERRGLAAPLPAGTRSAVLTAVAESDVVPTAALIVAGYEDEVGRETGEDGRLFVLFEGSAATVERGAGELERALEQSGVRCAHLSEADALGALQQIVDAYVAPRDAAGPIYRLLGPAHRLVERHAAIHAVAHQLGLAFESIWDGCTGDLIARFGPDDGASGGAGTLALDAAVAATADRRQIFYAPSSVRATCSMWGEVPASFAAMRDLKSRFDPARILAPGRFIDHL